MADRRAFLLLAFLAVGCGPRALRPPLPPPLRLPEPPVLAGPGSLWREEKAANYPFLDVRARFPGDLLTVIVSEDSKGEKAATTESSADSSLSASVDSFFGIPGAQFLPAAFKPSSIVGAKTKRSFKGDGTTSRTGNLSARITVRVTAVDAGGNLHVAGEKRIRVNDEEQYIVLSGVVRPEDISSANEVPSSRLAAARIDYYGAGPVGWKQRPGLVHTLMDFLWPF